MWGVQSWRDGGITHCLLYYRLDCSLHSIVHGEARRSEVHAILNYSYPGGWPRWWWFWPRPQHRWYWPCEDSEPARSVRLVIQRGRDQNRKGPRRIKAKKRRQLLLQRKRYYISASNSACVRTIISCQPEISDMLTCLLLWMHFFLTFLQHAYWGYTYSFVHAYSQYVFYTAMYLLPCPHGIVV